MSILFTFNGIQVVSTPVKPVPKSLDFTTTDFSAATSNPFAGQQQIQDWQASLVSMSVQLPPMTREGGGDDWSAFLMQCRGMTNAFLLGDATSKTPRGSVATTGASPLVNGANQVGYQFNTKGWVPGATGVLKRGDWIQIIYRLHKVLDDVDADGSGHATIAIYPEIRESPADGSAFITENAQGLFRLASNTNKYSISEAEIFGFQFNIREAI
jgi:hypothetical protein